MSTQWLRKCSLIVGGGGADPLDLSALHCTFKVRNADQESPNNAEIRVMNLSAETASAIQKNYTTVVLSAGYQNGNFGNIFSGTIKQFRAGRLADGVTSYLDILAADGDGIYNRTFINLNMKAGTTPAQVLDDITKAMNTTGDYGSLKADKTHALSLRGQVQFGLARARLRNVTTSLDAGWSIQDGKIIVTDNTGYRDGEMLILNRSTGLIGTPEQTPNGITATCLLNSRIRIGGRVQLTPDEINTTALSSGEIAPVSFDSYQTYTLAATRDDGIYRAFSVEHEGDTRGQAWYSKLILLAIDPTTEKV